jgi:hypothetical protein
MNIILAVRHRLTLTLGYAALLAKKSRRTRRSMLLLLNFCSICQSLIEKADSAGVGLSAIVVLLRLYLYIYYTATPVRITSS